MKINQIKCTALLLGLSLATAVAQTNALNLPPIADGPFKADWSSLTNYQTPEWFRDAKFGIWAHWGPQCEPEHGDWYARSMYLPGDRDYKSHLAEYGHPSTNGFKDVIHEWKAANFDPDKLLAFYKENGAKYFMALANHHDNFDNFNSKYQPWNSVAIGPQKDLIGGWAKAARKNGLRFAVSVHCSRAWSWYEPAQGADKDGPFAGVPYDGKLTKADGKGLWWDGLDPQDLYAQNHTPGTKLEWSWDPAKGSSTPDAAYMEKYFNRVKQLWDDYHPDQIYFDDSVLPFHGVTDQVGLNLAAHFYNSSIQLHGRNEAVMNNKMLDETEREAMVYDIERGKAEGILPRPWQTDTCIGSWHYDQAIFQNHSYKSAASVVRMLADIVSKNGNLMLSVPLQRDGQPDADEFKIVSEIGAWVKVNGEAIYATRPWTIYGEGPSTVSVERGRFGGQTDVQKKPFTAGDIRFTQSKDGKRLYAIVLALPTDGQVHIKSLALGSPDWPHKIGSVRLLGVSGKLKFTRDENGLQVTLPEKMPCKTALALKIQILRMPAESKVVVSGAFDDLKSGDLRFLEEAAKLGGLTVLLWPDFVLEQAGKAPKFPLAERAYFLRGIRYVSHVQEAGARADINSLPENLRPAIWADYQPTASPAREIFCRNEKISYRVFKPEELAGFPEPPPMPSAPGRKKVVATGCYDWVHSGHVRFAEEASAYGDLYLCLGSDANVRLLKGEGHPLLTETERRYVVGSIRFVKQALITTGTGWVDADPEIRRLKPDIYIVNEDGDRGGKREYCQKLGIEYLVLKRAPAPGLAKRSSTDLRGF